MKKESAFQKFEKIFFLLVAAAVASSLTVAPVRAVAAPKTQKAEAISEAPIKIEIGQARRLFIVGFEGAITIFPMTTGQEVTVRATKYMSTEDSAPGDMEALSQLVIKTANLGDTVEVRAQLPPTVSDWVKWAQGKRVPAAKLEIFAPESMSLEIYLTRGDVKVPRWGAPVSVTNQEGKITIEDIGGDVAVHSMYGAVKVQNIKGNVTLENFTSQITAEDISGKLKIKNFAGDTHVKKVNGGVGISSQKGGVFTSETTGPLEVQTGIAAIHIADHRGSLIGHSDSGPINAHVIGSPLDARLYSNTGPLTLAIPKGADTVVSMFSSKGNLVAPSSLESKRSPSGKVVRGNLGGGDGHVRLSSDSGDLTLKTF